MCDFAHPFSLLNPSANQHAIAVAVKSVARLNSVPVGSQHSLFACKRANQRQ